MSKKERRAWVSALTRLEKYYKQKKGHKSLKGCPLCAVDTRYYQKHHAKTFCYCPWHWFTGKSCNANTKTIDAAWARYSLYPKWVKMRLKQIPKWIKAIQEAE